VGLIKDGSGYGLKQQNSHHRKNQIHGKLADGLAGFVNVLHVGSYKFGHLGLFPIFSFKSKS
jgi:hypothetical protein